MRLDLSMNYNSLQNIEYERVWFFVRVFRLSLCMTIKSLFVISRSFAKISNHAQVMEKMHYEDHREAISGHDIILFSVGAIVNHISEVVVLCRSPTHQPYQH